MTQSQGAMKGFFGTCPRWQGDLIKGCCFYQKEEAQQTPFTVEIYARSISQAFFMY
jgi:hypothetical protein